MNGWIKRPLPKSDYLFEIYKYDKESNTFTIPVNVDTYNDLFNQLDPTPFRKRDLAPELMEYLDSCSAEIPLNYKVEVSILILKEARDYQREKEIIAGFKHYFFYQLNSISDRIRSSQKRVAKYVFISFMCITCSALLRGFFADNLFFDYVREGFTIGGWVFLWEAVSVNFIQRDDITLTMKLYERLSRSYIDILYE